MIKTNHQNSSVKMVCHIALLLLFLAASSSLSLSFAATESVTVSVKSVTTIAETDRDFICATIDWWPKNKCDYGQCPWGQTSAINLDLKNKNLQTAVKAFDPLRIRVGGSLEDLVVYKVGRAIKHFPKFKKQKNGLFGFSRGTLTMKRWDHLNAFFNKTNTKLIFGLNELVGKRNENPSTLLWVGDWDARNARDLMNYTAHKGYKIDSYELGNELTGKGVSARIEPEQYAKDTKKLREAVNKLYPDPNSRPKVLGPAGFFDKEWFKKYLQALGPNVIDGVTHHIYNLGAGKYIYNVRPVRKRFRFGFNILCLFLLGVDPTLINKVQDPYFLYKIAQTFKDVRDIVDRSGTGASAWVGESGGAYNSGGKTVSHTFANGFWYLDQLGMTSTFDHKVYCRQSLVGGNYGFLNSKTFTPNPDYYGALLWHRLMGNGVLATSHGGSPYLRTYTHCSKNTAGVTLLLINMSNATTFNILVSNDLNLYDSGSSSDSSGALLTEDREEYHLTPEGGNIQSDVVLLNGTPLKLTESGDIPKLTPKHVPASSPVTVAPDSFVYVTIKDFQAPAC
ncbi:Heparanase-like protein 1 [Linum grandiflorum]